MATKKRPINYTSREFDTIKTDLVKYAKRYYPDTFKDFTEASFGSMALDSVAYVGDMLSFYLDYQVNEMFLDSATEYDNVIRHALNLGHKYTGRAGSTGLVDVYALIPANSTGLGPDEDYMPILPAGAQAVSTSGASFTISDDIRFDDPKNEVVVARVDDTTGIPTHYAIRVGAPVVSGEIKTISVSIGAYEKFKKIKISNANVTEIISVVDASGHEYYEVEYLSQNIIYKDVANRNSDSTNAPSVLRPFVAARRFVTERLKNETYLQFGHGSDSELAQSSVMEPSNVSLKLHGRNYSSAESLDPSKLLSTDKFGIAPADTDLTIRYRINTSSNVNVPVGALSKLITTSMKFKDSTNLTSEKMSTVRGSLEVSNSSPIVGQVTIPDVVEIKRRAKDSFATQNRAVTKQDIEAMTYMMPVKFGAIKRCRTGRAQGTRRRNLELYILSEDTNGKLMAPTDTLKNNLKMWLAEKKMMNDTIDIKDAKIVNYGIEFTVVVDPNENKYEVLNAAIRELESAMKEPLFIGEPLYITDIYGILNKTRGVVDAKNVKISVKSGAGYSATAINIDTILSADGLTVQTPENVSLEVKFPSEDIKGSTE